MIKALKKKFVLSSMLAITVLILVLLGAVNVFNIVSQHRQTERIMESLSSTRFDNRKAEAPVNNEQSGFFEMPVSENAEFQNSFFVIRVGREGNIIDSDFSHIASVGESDAEDYLSRATEKEGKIGSFYYVVHTDNNNSSTYFFLDASGQSYAALRILLLSCIAGIVCWALMLLLVVFISDRAIKPIAENITKQRRFVTDAGHEIKTPLAIILSNCEAMELHNGESKWSKNIKEQVVRLNGLMQNLLTLAKAQEYEDNMPLERVNLTALTNEMADMFSEQFELKQLKSEISVEENVFVQGNRDALMRLLSILFDNAAKYADSGTTVKISLCHTDKAKFSITNDCSELPPDIKTDTLFERFYRGDKARTQKSGGYGIGLSAAKAIVENHKGSISSVVCDKAVTFSFTV